MRKGLSLRELFPEMEVPPVIIHFRLGFSNLNIYKPFGGTPFMEISTWDSKCHKIHGPTIGVSNFEPYPYMQYPTISTICSRRFGRSLERLQPTHAQWNLILTLEINILNDNHFFGWTSRPQCTPNIQASTSLLNLVRHN